MAKAINTLAPSEQMTHDERLLQAQTAVMLNELLKDFSHLTRQVSAFVSKLNLNITKEELKLISDKTPPAAKS